MIVAEQKPLAEIADNIKDAQNSVWIGSPLKGTDDWFVLSDKHAYDKIVGLRLDEEIPIL